MPPPEGPRAAVLTAGWGAALLRGGVAFLILVLLGQLLAFLGTVDDLGGAATLDVVRGGGMLFFLFNRVSLTVDIPSVNVPEAAGAGFVGSVAPSLTFAVALMLGTVAAAWLLYRGGRAVAQTVGEVPVWARAVHGAKVAVPYALLALGLSFLVAFRVRIPPVPFLAGGEPVRIGPAPISAFLWPLALGLLFGAWGGAATGRERLRERLWTRRAAAATAGGVRMAIYALVLAFVGYLVVALVQPDLPLPFGPRFFSALAQEASLGSAATLVAYSIMVVPNIATLVLVPAMGGAIGVFGSVAGLQVSCTVLSLTRFPAGTAAPAGEGFGLDPCAALPIEFGTAPIGYFAFLLVPLVATFLGGRVAARRGEAVSAAEGAGLGAAAGAVYALIVLVLSVVASVAFGASGRGVGFAQSMSFSGGPQVFTAALLALLWGGAGGALGGLTVGRGAAPPPAVSEPAPGGATGFEQTTGWHAPG